MVFQEILNPGNSPLNSFQNTLLVLGTIVTEMSNIAAQTKPNWIDFVSGLCALDYFVGTNPQVSVSSVSGFLPTTNEGLPLIFSTNQSNPSVTPSGYNLLAINNYTNTAYQQENTGITPGSNALAQQVGDMIDTICGNGPTVKVTNSKTGEVRFANTVIPHSSVNRIQSWSYGPFPPSGPNASAMISQIKKDLGDESGGLQSLITATFNKA